jgi:hypothetical protein
MDTIRAKLVYVREHDMDSGSGNVAKQLIYQFQGDNGTDIRFTTLSPHPKGWPVATQRFAPEALPAELKAEAHPNGVPIPDHAGLLVVRGDEGKYFELALKPVAAPADVAAARLPL